MQIEMKTEAQIHLQKLNAFQFALSSGGPIALNLKFIHSSSPNHFLLPPPSVFC